MEILIVGAGISGLTLASFLRDREGFTVDIIDRATDWNHLGYTIGIWDIGRRILSKLDLDDEFDTYGNPIKTFFLTNSAGHKMKLYHFDEFTKKYESAYTHINRKKLHDMLLERSGANVRMNTSIKSVEQGDSGVTVTFSDDSKAEYDLVVGADGINSSIREQVFGSKAQPTGNRVWFSWIPDEYKRIDTAAEIVDDGLICNIFDDPHATCMVLLAPEKPGTFDDPTTRIERLKLKFSRFPEVIKILQNLTADEVMPTDIRFVDTDFWHTGRIVLIGDAAHAMEPFGGIGASMGMEDAYVLADELCSVSKTDVHKALERYVTRRLPRVAIARRATRERYWWISSRFLTLFHLRSFLTRFIPISHFTKHFRKLLETQP